MKGILSILALIAILISSCSPKVIPVEKTTVDTVYVNRVEYDNVVWHDSVYIKEQIIGDTVFVDRYKFLTLWRNQTVRDTVYKVSVDTQTVKVVEYAQTRWQKFTSTMGKVFLALITAIFMILLLRLYLKRSIFPP